MKRRKLEWICLILAGMLSMFALGVYVGIEKSQSGQKVTVITQTAPEAEPEKTEETKPAEPEEPEEPESVPEEQQTLVNLNTAQLEELQTLPGIGPVLAQRILDYRADFGPFRTKEQIKDVKGIGDARFEQIEPLITVEDGQ